MTTNQVQPAIEITRLILANMTKAITKLDIQGHFELKQYMVQLIQSQAQFVGTIFELMNACKERTNMWSIKFWVEVHGIQPISSSRVTDQVYMTNTEEKQRCATRHPAQRGICLACFGKRKLGRRLGIS
ncbi:hypothetical protein HAX54_036413 [Datura stramonium]|uniref:Uncharacterized protein n=1 Tax=Datura stramonium TaxID=4076 RepID=A0ABS8VH01_DATST|nr:hypothetical protein [Datura stramonium]